MMPHRPKKKAARIPEKAKINETYLQMKLMTSDTLELRVIFERLSGAL